MDPDPALDQDPDPSIIMQNILDPDPALDQDPDPSIIMQK
jgi:hypothetical protein